LARLNQLIRFLLMLLLLMLLLLMLLLLMLVRLLLVIDRRLFLFEFGLLVLGFELGLGIERLLVLVLDLVRLLELV